MGVVVALCLCGEGSWEWLDGRAVAEREEIDLLENYMRCRNEILKTALNTIITCTYMYTLYVYAILSKAHVQ